MKVKCNVKINNLPDYAKKGFIVARKADHGELWFYGCYDTEEKAIIVSHEIDGNYFEIVERIHE